MENNGLAIDINNLGADNANTLQPVQVAVAPVGQPANTNSIPVAPVQPVQEVPVQEVPVVPVQEVQEVPVQAVQEVPVQVSIPVVEQTADHVNDAFGFTPSEITVDTPAFDTASLNALAGVDSNNLPIGLGLDIDDAETADDMKAFEKENVEDITEDIGKSDEAKIIATFTSTKFGFFTAILDILSNKMESSDILDITKGKVLASLEGGLISCDLTAYFKDNDLSLKDPRNAIKLLKIIKGSTDIAIVDDLRKYIIYNTFEGEPKQIININKSNDSQKMQLVLPEFGDLKFSQVLDPGDISALIATKAGYNALYYNIIIDVNTFELVEVNIEDKGTTKILNRKGRDLQRYRVKELFPVQKATQTIFKVFLLNNNDQTELMFLTENSNDISTIVYQTAGIKHNESKEAVIDFI